MNQIQQTKPNICVVQNNLQTVLDKANRKAASTRFLDLSIWSEEVHLHWSSWLGLLLVNSPAH